MEYELMVPQGLGAAATIVAIRRAEELGMAAVWSSETGHDPFLVLALAAAHSDRVQLGTAIAVAYGRSPYATAQVAWDLQRLSEGRFRLGLATQVKPHIERRYGVDWPGGAGALREYVACCRAIWHSWQSGQRPNFTGERYRYTLSNPEFEPGRLPNGHAEIPVWLGAVGVVSARMAGEVADGVLIHSFHTESYLRDVVFPAVAGGHALAGRSDSVGARSLVFGGIAHDEEQARIVRDAFRRHIAFYGSTKGYLPVLERAGAAELHASLLELSRAGKWAQMPELIDDALLDQFVVVDEPGALGRRLAARYDGLLDALSLYAGGDRFACDADWPELLTGLGASAGGGASAV
jgi:probable F420-dependent oxidoreductase